MSTQRELSNEYQHDRVYMIFKNICILVLRTKVKNIHAYGYNLRILRSPLKNRMPKDFTIAYFGHPVSKSLVGPLSRLCDFFVIDLPNLL